MSFAADRIHYADQGLGNNAIGMNQEMTDVPNLSEAEIKFMHFIQEYQEQNIFVYREQLQKNAREGKYFLRITMHSLMSFDDHLSKMLKDQPTQTIPALEKAIQKVFKNHYADEDAFDTPSFQLQVTSEENPIMLRDLQSNRMGKLCVVPGIITAASKTMIKSTSVCIRCSNCGHQKTLTMKSGFAGTQMPRTCDQQKNPGMDKTGCPLDPYRIVADKSDFMDQQRLKLQEAPELIPTGEMPRSFPMVVDRELCDKVTPGMRVKVVAILGIHSSAERQGSDQRVNSNFLRVVGLQTDQAKDITNAVAGFQMPSMTEEEIGKIQAMSKDPQLYQKLTKSIAPAIYGHDDIKKAIACLLFGGSPKRLPDGMRLRGDINVLLLGDPSVAKSQFLKFVERLAPICVYTSGKGASAAGLTAAVIKDNASGEFQLEGGAMVLADGGVVCIDEFDKMRAQDRVAIHEAMEQQTISIAKAGITTILNSRTSVLAAANPVQGRYDDLKHAAEQIDFQTSILSRFDTIFIVRDVREEGVDKAIASHVVNLHMGRIETQQESDVDLDFLRKYLCYAKTKVFPRLSDEAGHMLQDMYVTDRQASKEQQISKKTNGIPITVRQLEAIIRLSESIAKMHLCTNVEPQHVEEAHRLFRISTLNAAASGMSSASVKDVPGDMQNMVNKVQDAIKRRVAIGTRIAYPKLHSELTNRFDNTRAIDLAIISLVKCEDFIHHDARKILERRR